MNSHIKEVHEDERPFTCTLCLKTFKSRRSLDKHRATHNRCKLFSCTKCGKSFSYKGLLKEHMQTVHSERRFKCDMEGCSKAFSTKTYLKRHRNIHLGLKPNACPWKDCERRFRQEGQLKVHIHHFHIYRKKRRQHKNAYLGKKHKCDMEGCSKSYASTVNLKLHMNTHLGVKPYACPWKNCNRRFGRKILVQTHLYFHTAEKSFCRNDCGNSYTYSNGLRQHICKAANRSAIVE